MLYATAVLGVERALLTTTTFPIAICVLPILPNLNCRFHKRALLCVKSAILTIKTFPTAICAPEYNQSLCYIFFLDLSARSMQRDKNLYKSYILFTEFNSPPNLVRDKGIYSTRAGSILTSAGPA